MSNWQFFWSTLKEVTYRTALTNAMIFGIFIGATLFSFVFRAIGGEELVIHLVEAMGIDDFMVRRGLRSLLEPGSAPELEQAVVKLRPEIEARIKAAGLDDIVHVYHPDKVNPVSPVGSNLLYALPIRMLTQVSYCPKGIPG